MVGDCRSFVKEISELELLATKSEDNIYEIEALIANLKANEDLIKTLGKKKLIEAINVLNLLSSAYNKLIDFAAIKISNQINLQKCFVIRLFDINNLVICFYENFLFFDNVKINKRMNNLEKIIKDNTMTTSDFFSSNDDNYH